MRNEVGLVLFCWFIRDLATSIKLTELRVPGHAPEDGEALLGCQFDLQDDILYNIKWYKDGREFFRYVPRNDPPAAFFPAPGVNVDLSRSSSDVVTLTRLSAASAGLYRCEVSGEAPFFATVSDQKFISIHLLPDSGPRISSLHSHFRIGDRVVLNCSSPPSRPETLLKWWINDQPAPRNHLQGPWYRMAVYRPDAVETILQLRFTIMEKHFKNGFLKIKCHATIAPMYQNEAVEVITQEDDLPPEPPVHEEQALMSLDKLEVERSIETTTRFMWPVGDIETDSSTRCNISRMIWVVSFLILFQ